MEYKTPLAELSSSSIVMEMEQLLSMGFPDELAAQALAATGGKSILKATEWILSQSQPSIPKPSNLNSPPSPSSQAQPKLDRFFPFHSRPTQISDPQNPNSPKRLKSSPVSSSLRNVSKPSDPLPRNVDEIVGQSHILRPNSLLGSSIKSSPVSSSPSLPSPLRNVSKPSEPLAERMRPRNVDEIVGQSHILGPDSLLGSSIKCNRLPSIVLWGPPGTGKTSIAKAIASSSSLSYKFVSLSAVTSGVKDVREAVEEARKVKAKGGKRTVLFVDEVHRFNKSQQDSFLPVIEDGSIVFIGATTENPSFHLVTPLLSRCRVLTLNPLQPCDVILLLKRAIGDSENGLSKSVGVRVEVEDGAIELLSSQCDGDARVALNALEVCATKAAARVLKRGRELEGEKVDVDVETSPSTQTRTFQEQETQLLEAPVHHRVEKDEGVSSVGVNVDDAKEAFQCKHLAYDKAGEEHYNLISALHKSMRGSDADAALYWLARMLEGGEQPLYIARRLVRFASEDIGLADSNAVVQAVTCYQACHFIGMPECNVNLAQCVAYLALAPKSVAVYQAMKDAQKVVHESVGGNEGVPLHIRNAPTKLMKELGYGKGYIYTPDNPSAQQSFLPSSLIGRKFLEWPPRDA